MRNDNMFNMASAMMGRRDGFAGKRASPVRTGGFSQPAPGMMGMGQNTGGSFNAPQMQPQSNAGGFGYTPQAQPVRPANAFNNSNLGTGNPGNWFNWVRY